MTAMPVTGLSDFGDELMIRGAIGDTDITLDKAN